VNQFHERSHQSRGGGNLQVWYFVLDRTDERLPSIQVEVAGARLIGHLHNGDSVQAVGRFDDGVFHPDRIYSASFRAFVGPRTSRVGIFLVVAAAILAGIAATFVSGYRL
jgi:hypothetical protein